MTHRGGNNMSGVACFCTLGLCSKLRCVYICPPPSLPNSPTSSNKLSPTLTHLIEEVYVALPLHLAHSLVLLKRARAQLLVGSYDVDTTLWWLVGWWVGWLVYTRMDVGRESMGEQETECKTCMQFANCCTAKTNATQLN